MSMRGRSGGKPPALRLSLREAGWDPFVAATLRHSTLPWHGQSGVEIDLQATPLTAVAGFGRRDALSLTAQYAAHQAMLRFASLGDCDFDPAQWAVEMKRGKDCRLVRVAATPAARMDMPPLERIERFASAVGCDDLPLFEQPWAKPEAVFHEIHRMLLAGSTADLTWVLGSATGEVRSPGPEMLRRLFVAGGMVLTSDDPAVVPSVTMAAALLGRAETCVLGEDETSSPLRRYSALVPLARFPGGTHEGAAAESILRRLSPGAILVIRDEDRLDAASRSVLSILAAFDGGVSWVVPPADSLLQRQRESAPPGRLFVVSPRLVSLESLQERLSILPGVERRRWLEHFVTTDGYRAFCDDGFVPEPMAAHAASSIPEPERSYLGALSVVDREIPLDVAEPLLRELGCRMTAADLCVRDGIELRSDRIVFSDPAVQRILAAALPPSSRAAVAALAASVLESRNPLRSAALLCESGASDEQIIPLLESVDWSMTTPEETRHILGIFPRSLILRSAPLAAVFSESLLGTGRYADAMAMAEAAGSPERELLTARALRRRGEYSGALEVLSTVEEPSFAAHLLGAELLRLQGDLSAAAEWLRRAEASVSSGAEEIRCAYERSMLAIDSGSTADEEWLEAAGDGYLAARYRCYHALEHGNFTAAAIQAKRARELAQNPAETVDAALDSLYASFLAGDWERARHEARAALALVEEMDGDRAAGGILFTLAYLCADDGHFADASRMISRLEKFYARRGDSRRLHEIDLLAAHAAFCGLKFTVAKERAASVLAQPVSHEIREAAAIILDEVDWIECASRPPASKGDAVCVELRDRAMLNALRRGEGPAPVTGAFSRALSDFETARLSGHRAATPPASSGTEKLRLLRSLLGIDARHPAPDLKAEIVRLCDALALESPAPASTPKAEILEGAALRLAATSPFPFDRDALGDLRWRYASRNRLGQWDQIGSLPAASAEELDRELLARGKAAVPCGDGALLFVEGFEGWSPDSRAALASLFQLRAEHYRLRRVVEQENLAEQEPGVPVEGIVGSSPAMQEVLRLIHRVRGRDVPICILGESGTGKELVARAVHRSSARRGKPFVPLNCAALPESLVESELFGHVRGAFTGADRDRAGLVESTAGGTLFLDEVGELPLPAQAKLLRFLQDGEFRRVGDSAVRTADVRIVTATNRKLEQAVDEGRFREDLYYRIRVIELTLPPLRERGSDVVTLARHFLHEEREKHRAGPDRFTTEVEMLLLSHNWPGNVRELQNTVRAAHAMAGEARQVDLEHLPARLRGIAIVRTPTGTYFEELIRFRRNLVERSLAEAGGNQNQAAKVLGMSRQALAYQIRELGIAVRKK